jgi:hypothetical protein
MVFSRWGVRRGMGLGIFVFIDAGQCGVVLFYYDGGDIFVDAMKISGSCDKAKEGQI